MSEPSQRGTSWSVRLVWAVALGLFAALAVGSPAAADPAGPTDYLSEVVAIEPSAAVSVTVIGGDSFLQLVADTGTEVLVVGYQGEPYLWFQPDGTVLENRNAPSTYVNQDRFGGNDIPANASADAEPDWVEVASSGRYAWHDHRAHWMQRTRPLGQGPGDQILEAVIPLEVNGEQVGVTVISTWQPAPSAVPVWIGLALGAAAAAGAWALRRTDRSVHLVTIPLAAAAAVAGIVQFRSLPAETDPRALWWVLPTIAVVCAIGGLVAHWRRARFVADAATLLVGVELAIWGWIKRDGFSAALIPTDAPGWFDRLATAAALIGGVGLTGLALWWLFAPGFSGSKERSDSPLPAHP